MRTSIKLLTATALAGTLALAAGAASATTFIDVSIGTSGAPESHPEFTWTSAGGGLGTLSSVPGETATVYFDDPAFAAYSGLSGTTFTFEADNLTSGGGLLNNGTTLTETGLDGSFSFVNNGVTLLAGTITGGWLQGAIGANSANFNNSSGVVTFTSGIPGLLAGLQNESVGFSLTGLGTGAIKVTDSTMANFTATGASGSFDGQIAVPEPATWGLMIMGFGGAGALLRRRRRAVFA